MSEPNYPVTQGVRFLRANKVEFVPLLYDYVDRGGTAVAAQQLKIEEHAIVKTIVFEDERKRPVIVLMHGDREVSAKTLARLRGTKSYLPCDPSVVTKHTGYVVGGTSPFGTKARLPVVMQESVLDINTVYINGGKRGFLVGVNPLQIKQILSAEILNVAA